MFRLYARDDLAPPEEFRRVIAATTVAMGIVVAVGFWDQRQYSRFWIVFSWAFGIVAILTVRKAWHERVSRLRRDGALAYRTLLVGCNREADRLVTALGDPELGYRAIGRVATSVEVDVRNLEEGADPPVVGNIDDLRSIIRETGAECLFVASSAASPEEVAQVARLARLEGVEVRVSANLPELLSTRLSLRPLGSMFAVTLQSFRLTGAQAFLKRAFDLLVASMMVLLLLPVLAVIALLIKLTSPGPVLFRQTRTGRKGRTFDVLKFRTMVAGADGMRAALQELNEADGPLFKLRQDPRTTKVGRVLRRWSLDELPQLFNVLRGEMSLVGPRPAIPSEVSQYETWQLARLEVAPGITGLWQVSGRSNLAFEGYVRLDIFYIENWSLLYDLYILGRTLPAMIKREGAY
jgi:exopolysaccharide biosynthesis polyprenyl glycosylphosphotransferase